MWHKVISILLRQDVGGHVSDCGAQVVVVGARRVFTFHETFGFGAESAAGAVGHAFVLVAAGTWPHFYFWIFPDTRADSRCAMKYLTLESRILLHSYLGLYSAGPGFFGSESISWFTTML